MRTDLAKVSPEVGVATQLHHVPAACDLVVLLVGTEVHNHLVIFILARRHNDVFPRGAAFGDTDLRYELPNDGGTRGY